MERGNLRGGGGGEGVRAKTCAAADWAQGLGFRVRAKGSGFRVQGSGCRVQGSGFRVQGSGFRVQVYGLECRVKASGFRDWGFAQMRGLFVGQQRYQSASTVDPGKWSNQTIPVHISSVAMDSNQHLTGKSGIKEQPWLFRGINDCTCQCKVPRGLEF